MDATSSPTNQGTQEILLESIWNGKLVKEEGHLNEIRRLFLNNVAVLEDQQISIHKKILDCRSNLERVEAVHELFQWVPIPPEHFQKFQKNAQLSTEFRERGNREYKQDHIISALRGYNLAIMFGRPKQEETGLAFANRSYDGESIHCYQMIHVVFFIDCYYAYTRAAVFMSWGQKILGSGVHIENGQDAIQPDPGHLLATALRDMEFAEENNLPTNLKTKLVERRKKCQLIMPNIQQYISEKSIKTHDYKTKFFELDDPSDTVIGAQRYVHIHKSEQFGRSITVDKDTNAGAVVLIEKPFVAVLEKELRWDTEHCQFCLTRILAGIPCNLCTFGTYCDDVCRVQGHKFHQFEHKLMTYLHSTECSRRDLLALRIVEILGPEQVYMLYQKHCTGKTSTNKNGLVNDLDGTEVIEGFSNQGVYDSTAYSTVYNLVSHTDGEELYESVSSSFKALILAHVLQECSSFFDMMYAKNPMGTMEERSELFIFCASLILFHLQSIPYNAISISELCRADDKSVSNCHSKNNNFLVSSGVTTTGEIVASLKSENVMKSVSYATALFPLLALSNHSCSPNAVHVKIHDQKTALVTLRNLRKFEQINITYGPLFTVHDLECRKKILSEKYNFICECDACVYDYPSNIDSHTEATYIKNHITDMKEFIKFKMELAQVHKLIAASCPTEAMEKIRPCLTYFASNFPPWFSAYIMAQQLFKKALLIIASS